MSFAQHLRRVDDHNGWLFPIRSSYRARGLTYSIVRYSEFRNISSRVPNWLRACVSLERTRNIIREARKVSGVASALNPRAGKCAFAIRSDARS
jgi:hypothetical protein